MSTVSLNSLLAKSVMHSLPDSLETRPDRPICLTYLAEYRGNRVVSHVYPEQWAKVQIARYQRDHHGT